MERDKAVLLSAKRGWIHCCCTNSLSHPGEGGGEGAEFDVGWVRHTPAAVTHQAVPQALIRKCVVLLRNARWVTQNALTHPTSWLTSAPFKSLHFALLAAALMLLAGNASAAPAIQPISTAVIKSTTGLCLRGKTCHVDKAGVWTPDRDIVIVAASVAEQVDVALYVDIEISTKPEMYQCNETNADGCIFRVKYSGPGLYVYGANSGNTYLGSNVTNTNITFPAGTGIVVKKGVPVYVHLDVRNGSLIDLKVDQDAWLYYIPLDR
jgi:hypothetical protein